MKKKDGELKKKNPSTFISTLSPLLAINFSLAFNIKASYPFILSSQALATVQNTQQWQRIVY